jgi:hypothetical protein
MVGDIERDRRTFLLAAGEELHAEVESRHRT